jgi:hypothetical protein
MDAELRRAWTEIVTAGDYEQHMAAIGQAQAAADLTQYLFDAATPAAGSRIIIAGAGTGQMFDFLDATIFNAYRLVCVDLNPNYLRLLRERMQAKGARAAIVADDIEHSALKPDCELLLATLLLEHIDWRRGVEAFAELEPRICGIIVQENPPEMLSAITPGRTVPPSLAQAMERAHPTLIPREGLIEAMNERGYLLSSTAAREVADGKRLVALLFQRNRR